MSKNSIPPVSLSNFWKKEVEVILPNGTTAYGTVDDPPTLPPRDQLEDEIARRQG